MPNNYAGRFEIVARLKRLAKVLRHHLPFGSQQTEDSSLRWLKAMMRASVVAPLLLLLIVAVHAYIDENRAARKRVDLDARIVQEHALKVLETAASVAGRVDDIVNADPMLLSRANERQLHEKLADMSSGISQLQSVWVCDEEGNCLASDHFYPMPIGTSIANREFFKTLKRTAMPVALSGILRGELSGRNFFSLARRRQSSDGHFRGVISVGLSESYFVDFYRSIASTDKDLAVALVREDGTALLSYPTPANGIGVFPPGSAVMQAIRYGGSSRGAVYSDLDGMRRLVVVRKVGEYPVYIAVGVLRSTVMARWRGRMAMAAGFILPATIALVLLCWTALGKVGREHAALSQLRSEMARRITAEEALMRAQKMDAIGQMTGGVAHDFNNMLQIISSNVHIIRLRLPDAGIDSQLAAIDRARLSGESLTRQLLAFSRQQALRPEAVDVEQRMPSVCELIRHSLGANIQLECMTEPGTWAIEVDPSQLDLALFNLAINARDAMSNGGRISMRAYNVSAAERSETRADLRGDFVAIVVDDTGHGVPEEIAERIFEPFFTTKDVGKGTGLGLSQVYGFATQSGGTVTLKSIVGEGTTMTIYLPRAHMQTSKRPVQDVFDASYAAKGRLLVVEDNVEVGEGLAQLLGEVGFTVTLVHSAVEAIQILGSDAAFDLLLTDLVMPGNFNGLQLARLVMLNYPTLPVILMTGYSSEVRKASAEGFTILIKPFQMSALITAIRERLDQEVERR